jgi:type VI secretion system protein ImpH
VKQRLLAESRHFEFFQLVRLLTLQQPDAVAPGGEGPAARENVRFRPALNLGFPSSDVDSVEELPGGLDFPARFRVTVNFMGLYGPSSPMPNHFTEDMLGAGDARDPARDFIDLFHHRTISLLYRAWGKYRYPLQFTRERTEPFTHRLLCLMGLGTPGMVEGTGLPAVPLLRTGGALSTHHRSAAGLEGYLRNHFEGVDIRVIACVERLAPIPAAQLNRLGGSGSRLGQDAYLGERVRDRTGAFRIRIGAMSCANFRSFLPRGERLRRLALLTRLYVRDPLSFDVELLLVAPEVPPLRLSPPHDLPLGQMSWLAPRGREQGRARVPMRGLDPLTVSRASRAVPAAAPARSTTTTTTTRPQPRTIPPRRS